jgi:hypothetical protein
MGVQRVVRHPVEAVADWPSVRDRLATFGESPVVKMIDGLPAFPDEVPADDWKELRVGLTGGMVTIRRQPGTITCVAWGTDDPILLASLNAVAAACAAVTGGAVLD